MVKVQPNSEHDYYLDGYLKSNLDDVIHSVTKKDYDSFIIVTGKEGVGKSTIAGQIAMYLDPTYCLDRCCFTADQFVETCEKADKFQAVVFDETMGYLSSRGTMSMFNRKLVKIMSEMRSKNLFVILCIPSFFELDRYPAIHRSTGLIHVYKRAHFGSYDYKKKKDLYLQGKKTYSYVTPPTFIGKCTKYFPLNKEDYEAKKQKAIREWDSPRKKQELTLTQKRHMNERDILVVELINLDYDHQRIADLISLSQRAVMDIAKKIEKEAEAP